MFNELAKYYDVTVIHSGNISISEGDNYKEIIVPVKKIGPFYFQSNIIKEVRSNNFDIVIGYLDVRWVYTVLSIYFNKESKYIWWGAWLTKSKVANLLRLFFTKKSDANVFYTHNEMQSFICNNISKDNLFVANNTIDVGARFKSYDSTIKSTILLVGSLDKRKQNDVTIRAFNNIIGLIPEEINMIIIGSGEQREYLEKIVLDLDLSERVFLKGAITNPKDLELYYQKAIVSVSFGQAGLSVLQAIGFGVPFLTKKNAISGGEKFNIKNGVNGIFCKDDIKSLEQSLVKLCTNMDYSRNLGKNAYQYYSDYCTIENMAQGFIDAIEGTNLANIDKGNEL